MGAVDFAEWAAPGLELKFGGRTYIVQPPSVRASRQILAAAIRGEVALGWVPGPVPLEVQEVLDSIGDEHPGLGKDVYEQMVADDVPQASIDRMAYYAVFYWARGREYATALARLLWSVEGLAGGEKSGPKG